MELAPCNEISRQMLVDTLDRISIDAKQAEYIVKLFPNVLLDLARLLIDQATRYARQPIDDDTTEAIRQQLKPFFTFGFLLGKSPQITSLMYGYFEQSSFQPLPENLFKICESDGSSSMVYSYAGFSDELLRDILKTYIKYLIFNPKLFSSVWNWSELGRIIALHPNHDLKYLAMCGLAIITQPNRHQHLSMLRNMIEDKNMLIDIQIKYCPIYDNVFTPLIESNPEKREQIMDAYGGRSQTGYSFDSQTLTNVVNILLLKHDISSTVDHRNSQNPSEILAKIDAIIQNYIPVKTLCESLSRTAYTALINKPCLIRGPPGSGKSSLIDYIAAKTNRVGPPVYVKVQVGDQIDSKMLVGSYVCTEIPGQFEWQPGPLTQAMAYGSWIVFEDIDLAPPEMAQVIHSVIENGNLSCVSSCPIKMDSPHPDFRIFFTQRTCVASNSLGLGFGFVERLCDVVDIPQLKREDLMDTINKRYNFASSNHDLTEKILQLYEVAERLILEVSISRAPRLVTLRDLFKFCDRIEAMKIPKSNDGKYSVNDIDAIMSDAIDCFIRFLPETLRVEAARTLGQILNKPAMDIDSLLLQRKPDIRLENGVFSVGRAKMDIIANSSYTSHSSLANTRQSVQLLESISLCIKSKEPVLLVGETGVGKTTIVQYLASVMKIDLVVLNLSQQSDSSDLLGGYRPVEMREIIAPINEKFNDLFKQTFDQVENREFLQMAEERFLTAKKCSEWLVYLKVVQGICGKVLERSTNKDRHEKWSDLMNRVRRLSKRMSEESSSPMALSFVEGTLLRAVRKGRWLLLDEINLAEPDVLQCLLLILDSMKNSYVYTQGADCDNEGAIKIHPNFRIFACMNPSTDIGKRDLPASSRARFTEFFVDDIKEKHELRLVVESYVKACLTTSHIENIVNFYQEIREKSTTLSDISGLSPVFSLRTLCRALIICESNVCRDMEKSLLEAFMVTFLQQLNEHSVSQVMKLLQHTIFKKTSIEILADGPIQMPQDGHQYIQVEGFWIQTSSQRKVQDENYILSNSVRVNLKRICRIISQGQRKLPILIQGNTSVGKTSLIKYLAKLSGNLCYRINNHEHTDLQDYVGRYVLREDGELQFQEGLLVKAMKKGYWVILDELNLAPSELLEALNRVLDDNRELFIPETREVVRAHSKFMLFATQNPPEEYAGRKLLSRAFRNRFIELNFDEIPHLELEEILHKRCKMPPQYAKKIVTVMRELQVYRRESGCFSGKNSFMTIRDLFRWGQRYLAFKDTVPDTQSLDWEEFLAGEGLVLLEGRVRTRNEAETVKTIIEKVFKRKLDRSSIYIYNLPPEISSDPKFKHVDLTEEYRRTFVQLSQALKYNEPILLCGQTGCGKTTACQIYAKIVNQELITYNCHLNTECADFVGNVRPARQSDQTPNRQQKFPWVDGPLVQAMRTGAILLMDEISLAEDAVLERINSVLEPERSITLTEKDGTEIVAKEKFRFVATMNPGGDYGKKELSPALRNRFTEIYCHNPMDVKQIMSIVEKKLNPSLLKPKIAPNLIQVVKRFLSDYYRSGTIISLRDVLSWVEFINRCTMATQIFPLSVQLAILDGAYLVYFDQFGTCGHKASHSDSSNDLKLRLISKIERLVESKFGKESIFTEKIQYNPTPDDEIVKVGHYCLRKGPLSIPKDKGFVFDAPTVSTNTLKLVRALQLDRPILIEGDPGAGKTSLVAALARKTGHKLIRINLSEQTDISDLFGSDLPDASNPNDDIPRFCWHDGPLLRALKDSNWILLDEMNLASQSVLEGLNACFDHRGEIFIPELNKTFSVNRISTRIFACQNPYDQGAARKGLPKSFLNRFTSIYVESHTVNDLIVILHRLYPNLPKDIVNKMVVFNHELNSNCRMQGYEFNLRDLIYWCDLTTKYVVGDDFKDKDLYDPDRFVQFVYVDRLRSLDERVQVSDLFETIFGYPVYEPPYREFKLGEFSLLFSRAILPRSNRPPPHLFDLCILKYQMPYLESIAKAIESNKMPILVGETGTGKRSMVRILAGLTGNKLSILAANREMDTIELLGSYEQKSLQREMVDLVQDASVFATSLINSASHRSQDNSWTQLYKHIWSTLYATSSRDLRLSKTEMMDAYRYQLRQMEDLLNELKFLSTNNTENRRQQLRSRIRGLSKKLLFESESTYSCGNFEWIDSVLVKSIKEGHWLMIENANLMNPATLDRLNSLVEPDGSLSLSEKGSGEDGIELLRPHPNFRLILTMNPEFGELSRAMRNRGIEIYVRTRFYFEDFLMLLKQNGFKPTENTSCLSYCIMQTCYDTHLKVTGEEAEVDGASLAYFGLNHLSSLAQQIRRGVLVDEILAVLLISFYRRKGFLENDVDDCSINSFVYSKMSEYKRKYVVDLNDDRYKWSYFMHDLVSMTGGDATTAMLVRENRLFWESTDPISSGLLRIDEVVDCLDIVNTCTTVKIFMELSTQGDFEYRKGFIKDIFTNFPKLTDIVNKYVNILHEECMPIINNQMPHSSLIPVSEMYVDTRNSADLHYYLMAIDYKGTTEREDMQNRWLLSLHRSIIEMVIKLIEDRTSELAGNTNLCALAEKVRSGEMLKEDLIRPQAEIALDLHDFLLGILQVVGDRCFNNNFVTKMLSRFFWIGYFLCKLKRGYNKMELVAVCNQIPMLWALTYQKIIVPIIKDCDLADLNYNNRKFSDRIKQICQFLDVNITKPSHSERDYYYKVVNLHAATTKRCETISREVDKFFNYLLARYTLRSQSLSLGSDIMDVLGAAGLNWSNSTYLMTFYKIQDMMRVEVNEEDLEEAERARQLMFNEAKNILHEKRGEHNLHEEWLKNDSYRTKLVGINRRRSALDQFAPIWQVKFLHIRLSLLNLESPKIVLMYREPLRKMLHCVNGVMMSPRYYGTLMKFFRGIEDCLTKQNTITIAADESLNDKPNANDDSKKINRRYMDMYATFLVDHIMENIVLDNQVVGWTKMRVTTSDLSSSAPLIPEYAPIISLVSSYCLDIAHLKLNSYQNPSPQLDSMLVYLWRSYALIKNDPLEDLQDIALAKNFIHARCFESENRQEVIGDHTCPRPSAACVCIEAYIERRGPKFHEMINVIRDQADPSDVVIIQKAIKLIYFGFYTMLEFAPVFTLDPSLRSREKLEVYNSEMAHIKLDLHQRNTLYYWKTGENLRLVDIAPEEAKMYPFSVRVLVERRYKLERSIKKLRKEYTNRPKSDDGTMYYELRKEVEVTINRYTKIIETLVTEIFDYLKTKKPIFRAKRLLYLNTKCRMLIKSIETTIVRFKSDYVLYNDLTTYYLVGLSFMLQGMRRLYSRLEPKMQLNDLGFTHVSVDKFSNDIMRLFSFNAITMSNLESVANKRSIYSILDCICPTEKISHVQSLLLRSILIQLNHHITMTPSDIKQCIPIVQNVVDKFHKAWLSKKIYLEEQLRKQEELYQYRTPTVNLGNREDLDRDTFIEICKKFPVYDHVYHDELPTRAERLSAEEENLTTEAKIINLNQSVDLTMCIDVCKAHYKLMKEASFNLLGHLDCNVSSLTANSTSIQLGQLVKLEAEILYTIMRKCALNFDKTFDSLSLECHLLQANELIKLLRGEQTKQSTSTLSNNLNNSIEILDEYIFDIYHDADLREALRLQEFMSKVDNRVNELRRSFEAHPCLSAITRLTTKISTFLMTDPLMKFVTGAHMLLQCLEEWNQKTQELDDLKKNPKRMRECRLTKECDELVELIKSWREIEVKSWRSCLHRVKKKYIDDSLCDLWFRLYEAFKDPVAVAKKKIVESGYMDPDEELSLDESFYQGFMAEIKQFIEESTLGDYQIRLDLIFSFAIQTRFASLFEQSKSQWNPAKKDAGDNPDSTEPAKIDYEKLTTYVYNMFRSYQGLLEPLKKVLEKKEGQLRTELNDQIRFVNWRGRNAWEVKNNFRISHRRLNRVMNDYLKVLSERLTLPENDGVLSKNYDSSMQLGDKPQSKSLLNHYSDAKESISSVSVVNAISGLEHLTSLTKAPRATQKMVELSDKVCELSSNRYVTIVEALEDSLEHNCASMQNFHKHKVSELMIGANDSKETREAKLKTCRQTHHSKRYALQAIFKNLQEIGVSHQRGMNNFDYQDKMILSLEPLRGMIQSQSHSTLQATSNLVDDTLVTSCNELYQQMISRTLYLFTASEKENDKLTSDHLYRMRGYTADLKIDILKHNRNAAMIYRHMIDIQASATRLSQLQERYKGAQRITIYNFAKIHQAIQSFDKLVGKTMSSFLKLDLLIDCHQTHSQLWNSSDENYNSNLKAEKSALRELIGEIDEKNSLLTESQFMHIKQNLATIRTTIEKIGAELRDKLKHTIKNYLYDDHDVDRLKNMCTTFVKAFESLFPNGCENKANFQKGTILGSIRLLLIEAKLELTPMLDILKERRDEAKNIDCIKNADKLNLRLQKLIKQTKLSTQEIYKEEVDFTSKKVTSESEKRNLKPFNHIDSSKMRDLLRPNHVAKRIANCFITLNAEEVCDVEPFVSVLTPMMHVYNRNLACYLNVILSSIQLKLKSVNQLAAFFKDVVEEGFGLPYTEQNLNDIANGNTSGKADSGEENAGFGEGEGQIDASNKLEFESQLDELKKIDGNDNDKKTEDEQQGENKPIKQSDDGIEMTDDFDAEAQGPEYGSDGEPDEDENDDMPGDQDALEEFDKALDEVDEDEGHLDHKLWDEDEKNDDEGQQGEDDEEDLRQADMDKSVKPDTSEIDLKAKDENLQQSSEHSDSKSKETASSNIDENDTDKIDDNNEKDDESTSEITGVDEQRLNEQDEQTDKMEEDFDISELNEQEEKIDKSKQFEEITLNSDGEEEQNDSIDDVMSTKSAGDEMDTISSVSSMNDDLSEEIPTQCDENYQNASQQVNAGGMDASEKNIEDQVSNLKSKEKQQSEVPKPADVDDNDKSNDQQVETIKQGNGGEQLGDQDFDKNEDGAVEMGDEDGPSKRTFADRNSIDEQSAVKRQRIEAAKAHDSDDCKMDASKAVRHLEENKSSAIEVIDLAEDSDDELLLNVAAELERFDEEEDFGCMRKLNGSKHQSNEKGQQSPEKASDEDENGQIEQIGSTYNTNLGLLKYITLNSDQQEKANVERNDDSGLIEQIDKELGNSKVSSIEHESIEMDKLTKLWSECTRNTSHLIHELCQQLQIVLQPTKMSKYRGDYKTGKRLNMRKIISYIASHYRKDKIWLRRTKPSKRTYNISLAVDNSSSMSENNCRAMTYQSLALLAHSLSLIEAGSLNVVKFGEQAQCIHEFGQPYMDAVGAQWLKELRFNEKQTSYTKMLKFSCESFANQARQTLAQINLQHSASVHQLLIVISDGRNVSSEEEDVKCCLRELKSLGVLTLFVIIDDLKRNDGKSIVDVKSCVRYGGSEGKGGVRIENYMDLFPFPFYVLLRQIETMPSILGDALRQWFELISNVR